MTTTRKTKAKVSVQVEETAKPVETPVTPKLDPANLPVTQAQTFEMFGVTVIRN